MREDRHGHVDAIVGDAGATGPKGDPGTSVTIKTDPIAPGSATCPTGGQSLIPERNGAVGPQGPQGPAATASTGYTTSGQSGAVPGHTNATITLNCPDTYKMTFQVVCISPN